MSKIKVAFSLEGALSAAGIDVAAAKASLAKLDEAFGGQGPRCSSPRGCVARVEDGDSTGTVSRPR